MPDQFGFDHLPWRGIVEHRCIEDGCNVRGSLSEADRRRHHATHEREHRRRIARTRDEALRKGRKTKKQMDMENDLAYGKEDE